MPLEERFITFSLEEVLQAVQMRAIQESLDIPTKGTLIKIEIDEKNTGMETLIFLHLQRSEGTVEKLKFDRKFFALALIFYCQGCGIPLPQRGTKTLNILPDQIVMKIELKNKPQ
ncbi:MAG: hypothetical protein IT559_02950 [Alphaproteobacteria bacterium]|nr:hypothetical protein [Alphaproteobacteria bacterium]